MEIRAAVASNPGTNPATLEVLSWDRAWKVRERVAKNPSKPEGLVQSFIEDPDQGVKKAARARLAFS